MRTTFKTDSPLDQMRRRRTVALKPSAKGLSPLEQEQLKAILDEPMDYVTDVAFSKSNAQKKLFDEAPEIPKPNTSWYHPVMEDLSSTPNMKSVVNVVLTAKQEQALFLQFNYARYRVAKLQKAIGDKPVTDKQAAELLEWYNLSRKLRDQIAQSNLALVLAMAKRVRHSDMDFADLISEGNMALLRAIDKFNVARGFKFSTYACRAILKAFSRSGMKHSQYRQLFPTDFDPALERSDFTRRKFDEHEGDCADEVSRIVRDNRAELTDVELSVINHRFALNRREDDNSVPLTLEQVGQIVGLTKERVRQIQNKALEKIRTTLEESFIDGQKPEEILEIEKAAR
ncbi:MAG: sigma-70 family RNA polymerase sigma factor [Planctomycetes bacterium]|nr:sigma-70 family RNA polymerase sigma factor [Planctomycetota bacterium]